MHHFMAGLVYSASMKHICSSLSPGLHNFLLLYIIFSIYNISTYTITQLSQSLQFNIANGMIGPCKWWQVPTTISMQMVAGTYHHLHGPIILLYNYFLRPFTVFARYLEVLGGGIICTVDQEKGKVGNKIIVT